MQTNISRSKCNHAMQFGQFIEYNFRNIFFKYLAENEAGRLVPDLFLFFKNAVRKVKTNGQHLFNIALIYFGRPLLKNAIKTNFITCQTVDL